MTVMVTATPYNGTFLLCRYERLACQAKGEKPIRTHLGVLRIGQELDQRTVAKFYVDPSPTCIFSRRGPDDYYRQ